MTDVTVLELRYGAFKSNRTEENLAIIDDFLSKVKVIPFSQSIDLFCQEKLRLQKSGTPIEDFDLLIGCAAKATGLTMVTDNVQHFNRIEGLRIDNWIRR